MTGDIFSHQTRLPFEGMTPACSWTSASFLTFPELIGRDRIFSNHMSNHSSVKMRQTPGIPHTSICLHPFSQTDVPHVISHVWVKSVLIISYLRERYTYNRLPQRFFIAERFSRDSPSKCSREQNFREVKWERRISSFTVTRSRT
jgi:hypothetical protein